jgi:SNF2 family DNA or RNA helicase
MGLGKTVQALAAAELLRRRRGIQRVLVVAPASVKYQWLTEIEKFTDLPAQVIDGSLPRRRELYGSPKFYNLSSYELVLKDVRYMHELAPDLIILDEAQRIRNWTTATARTIKQLKSPYDFVLTGTPLENKLEELFSVVEFIDGRRLGPAFRFLHEHRMEDENGRLIGYRGLDRIHDRLAPILLRRTRQEVLKDLPQRTDQILHVSLTPQQAEPLALGNRPAADHVLPAEHAYALRLHVSFRQTNESFAEAGGVSRDRPRAGDRRGPQSCGLQRV